MYKVGDKVRVIDKIGHTVPLGFIGTISYAEYNSNQECQFIKLEEQGMGMFAYRVEPIDLSCTCGTNVCANCREYRKN